MVVSAIFFPEISRGSRIGAGDSMNLNMLIRKSGVLGCKLDNLKVVVDRIDRLLPPCRVACSGPTWD